jgi:hypothetical protein
MGIYWWKWTGSHFTGEETEAERDDMISWRISILTRCMSGAGRFSCSGSPVVVSGLSNTDVWNSQRFIIVTSNKDRETERERERERGREREKRERERERSFQ